MSLGTLERVSRKVASSALIVGEFISGSDSYREGIVIRGAAVFENMIVNVNVDDEAAWTFLELTIEKRGGEEPTNNTDPPVLWIINQPITCSTSSLQLVCPTGGR